MSTSDLPTNKPKKLTKKIPTGISWSMIIILVVLFSSFLIYDTISHNKKGNGLVISAPATNNTKPTRVIRVPSPKNIFSRTGNIESINNNVILIKPNEATTYTVITTDKTKYLKVKSAPFYIPAPNTNVPSNTQEISLSDLKAGDKITAIASENIKEKSEFAAQEIKVME